MTYRPLYVRCRRVYSRTAASRRRRAEIAARLAASRPADLIALAAWEASQPAPLPASTDVDLSTPSYTDSGELRPWHGPRNWRPARTPRR